MRPSSEVPLSEEIAFSASSVVAISTKPKPRERPVSRSVITAADITSPKRANAPRRPSLEVENERPPTNSFTDMTCPFRLPDRIPPSIPVRLLQRSSTRNAAHHSSNSRAAIDSCRKPWPWPTHWPSGCRSRARGSERGGRQEQDHRGQRQGDQRGLREDLARLPLELAGRPGIGHGLHAGRRLAHPARGQRSSRPAASLEHAQRGHEEGEE